MTTPAQQPIDGRSRVATNTLRTKKQCPDLVNTRMIHREITNTAPANAIQERIRAAQFTLFSKGIYYGIFSQAKLYSGVHFATRVAVSCFFPCEL